MKSAGRGDAAHYLKMFTALTGAALNARLLQLEHTQAALTLIRDPKRRSA